MSKKNNVYKLKKETTTSFEDAFMSTIDSQVEMVARCLEEYKKADALTKSLKLEAYSRTLNGLAQLLTVREQYSGVVRTYQAVIGQKG